MKALLVFLFPTLLHAQTAGSVFFQRAEEYYAAGRYLEAVSFYNDCVNNSDTEQQKAAALFGLGLLFDRYLDDPERALDYYKTHIELQGPRSAAALHYSARILVRYARCDDARIYYHNLIRNHSTYSAAHRVVEEFENCSADLAYGAGLFDLDRLKDFSGTVRVLIYNANDPLVIKGKSGLHVASHGREEKWKYRDDALVIHADNNSLYINSVLWGKEPLVVRGSGEDTVQVNGLRYRSRVSVRARQDTVQVINHVSLDHYLYGVLPREVYVSWPSAALKAQAVAARTYVLYHMLVRQDKSYDVLSTTSSQVYGGLDREHPATNRAVDETSSQVLFNGRHLALTLYHANSGGVVESVEDVWGARLPHLQRVVDTASLQGRHSRWSCALELSAVAERLENCGLQSVGLENLEVVRRSPSGRVSQIALKGQGSNVLVSGNSLRLMLGPAIVKSTRFVVEHAGDVFTFTGFGYGHGVGMSQWGACALAKKGAAYEDILAHYYPGAETASWLSRIPVRGGL